MKVHPVPRIQDITFRYDVARSLPCRQKKLRRLPHVFAKVLELPFHSDTEVSVHETPHFFRFVVSTDDVGDDVRAHTIEIHPGVSKIVILGNPSAEQLLLDDLDLDLWRFRLPSSTLPNQATAAYIDGELMVFVPKGVDDEDEESLNRGGEGRGSDGGSVQLVAAV